MSKKTLRFVSILLCILTVAILMLPNFAFNHASAATRNVSQSRRIVEIEEFPLSYQAGLKRVKTIYPNAQFIYYDTGLDWYKDLLTKDAQLRRGTNLIPSSSPSSWKSKEQGLYDPETDTYEQIEPGWNQASTEAIEYYMDPRNFFNEKDIFQFLNLAFDGTQSVAGTQSVLGGSFMANRTMVDDHGNTISFAEALYKIGKESGVSPYLLACRIRQEQGSGGSSLISGTYSKVPGYYNYFNIAATGSTTEAIITNGLNYAKSHGWNTPYKSILGGADVLAKNYVDAGKNCLYLHHFNVTAKDHVVSYSVYMANTTAPYYETKMMANACADKNAPYSFIIPVYNNMPTAPCDLPGGTAGRAYLLKDLALNDGTNNVDFGNFSSYEYYYKVSVKNIPYISIRGTLNSNKSKMAINGIDVEMGETTTFEKSIMLNPGFNDIVITVTASNGICRDYTVQVWNDDGDVHYRSSRIKFNDNEAVVPSAWTIGHIQNDIQLINCVALVTDEFGKLKNSSDACVSGDNLIVKNKNNKIIYKQPIMIRGDIDKDGTVTNRDINMVKAHMLETYTLTLREAYVADIDKDGQITVKDIGLMRLMTDGVLGTYSRNITINPNVPAEIYNDKRSRIGVEASSGAYCAEGYLVYNEGRGAISGGDNSGRIHFIADGSTIILDNNKDYVEFMPMVRSGSIEFSVEIIQAYDYSSNQNIDVATETKMSHIENSELDIDIQLNESAVEGSHKYHAATLQIKNKSSMSLGNITVNLGEYFVGDKDRQIVNLTGLRPGSSHKVKIYNVEDLRDGEYCSEIKIEYHDANMVESLMTIPITFEVLGHDHDMPWRFDDINHIRSCEDCGDEEVEKHIYYKESNGVYKCVKCDYVKNLELRIGCNEVLVGEGSSFTTNILMNDIEVDSNNFELVWYVDGVETSREKELLTTFDSVGHHEIECVATDNDGLVVAGFANAYASQSKSDVDNSIFVIAATCKNIALKKYDGYEYKLNDGDWQDEAAFVNLIPGQEYTVWQRQKGAEDSAISVSVVASHRVNDYANSYGVCGDDIEMYGKCLFCKNNMTKTVSGTSHNHLFVNYEVKDAATCVYGTLEESKCSYGCGAKNTRTLDDKIQHRFTNYLSDNNKTCTSGGTSTAFCDYNCGTADIVPMEVETAGHRYNYRPDNNATIQSSMTESGICAYCGKSNTRVVDGTRLTYLTEINVTLSNATTAQVGLPVVDVETDGVSVNNTKWQNSSGVEFDGNAQDVVIRNNETYKLTALTLNIDGKYLLHEDAKIYVNGKLFAGDRTAIGNLVTLIDVGQFQF